MLACQGGSPARDVIVADELRRLFTPPGERISVPPESEQWVISIVGPSVDDERLSKILLQLLDLKVVDVDGRKKVVSTIGGDGNDSQAMRDLCKTAIDQQLQKRTGPSVANLMLQYLSHTGSLLPVRLGESRYLRQESDETTNWTQFRKWAISKAIASGDADRAHALESEKMALVAEVTLSLEGLDYFAAVVSPSDGNQLLEEGTVQLATTQESPGSKIAMSKAAEDEWQVWRALARFVGPFSNLPPLVVLSKKFGQDLSQKEVLRTPWRAFTERLKSEEPEIVVVSDFWWPSLAKLSSDESIFPSSSSHDPWTTLREEKIEGVRILRPLLRSGERSIWLDPQARSLRSQDGSETLNIDKVSAFLDSVSSGSSPTYTEMGILSRIAAQKGKTTSMRGSEWPEARFWGSLDGTLRRSLTAGVPVRALSEHQTMRLRQVLRGKTCDGSISTDLTKLLDLITRPNFRYADVRAVVDQQTIFFVEAGDLFPSTHVGAMAPLSFDALAFMVGYYAINAKHETKSSLESKLRMATSSQEAVRFEVSFLSGEKVQFFLPRTLPIPAAPEFRNWGAFPPALREKLWNAASEWAKRFPASGPPPGLF